MCVFVCIYVCVYVCIYIGDEGDICGLKSIILSGFSCKCSSFTK